MSRRNFQYLHKVTFSSIIIPMEQNLISQAIEIVGLAKLAKVLGVTYQAIRKWEIKGRLPRTEWTGETNYAAQIEAATEGKILKESILSAAQASLRPTAAVHTPETQKSQEAA